MCLTHKCVVQYCQMCKKGDNEDLLLLCDGCDKGCHTYCHKPKITSIPEGDWYCPACISKVLFVVKCLLVSTFKGLQQIMEFVLMNRQAAHPPRAKSLHPNRPRPAEEVPRKVGKQRKT